MCTRIALDERQKEILKACDAESKLPNRSLFARLKTALTMIVLGMHAASSRVPVKYDENNRPF
ncbi:MAG: hypothetical protein A3H44_10440 [Gammaproteobacteria bacterium RIFCSPLOWO2_02_FULL_57_10]|nr:MAG: hypothetical protein A3H44_10440 [Gammaproteobacteria bacterium RIFCSPLOWO2_02_FULL_57_10]